MIKTFISITHNNYTDKEMTIDKIGTNAGAVWRILDASETPLTVKEIKKGTKISTLNDVYLAIGWLAKEGKLVFGDEGKDFTVTLRK